MVATINGKASGIWVEYVWNQDPNDQPFVHVQLNRRTPAQLSVGSIGFDAALPAP